MYIIQHKQQDKNVPILTFFVISMAPHVGLEGGTVVLINFNNNNNDNNNKNNNNSNDNNNNNINNVFSLRGLHINYKMNSSNIWSSVKLNKKEHIYSRWLRAPLTLHETR